MNLKAGKFRAFDVSKLYASTLHHSGQLRPWSVDDEGKYIGLEYRKNFVLDYLKDPLNFNSRDTDYYEFLQRGQSFSNLQSAYEGNASWRYAKPELFCDRFVELIKRTIQNPNHYDLANYFEGKPYQRGKLFFNLINRIMFELKYPAFVIYNETKILKKKPEGSLKNCIPLLVSLMAQKFNKNLGLFPIVEIQNQNEIVKNGCHRLAILEALSVHQRRSISILCYVG